MNVLQRWMSKATPAEKVLLAEKAGTTRGGLSWLAGGYRTQGRLDASPALARGIELAAKALARAGLPALRREDLCIDCSRCELARRARAAERKE